jgi:hypothetical protein
LASALVIAAVALVYNHATRDDNGVTREAARPKHYHW